MQLIPLRRYCLPAHRANLKIQIHDAANQRGLIKIWDEKKGFRRFIMPANEALSALRKYLNSLEKQPKTLFPLTAKTVERLSQGYSKQALGSIISWHSLRPTYLSGSVELEQPPAVVMAIAGDLAATILRYYAKLPEVVMKRFVVNKPMIPFPSFSSSPLR